MQFCRRLLFDNHTGALDDTGSHESLRLNINSPLITHDSMCVRRP